MASDLRTLVRQLRRIVDTPRVAGFDVGRGVDPNGRCDAKQADACLRLTAPLPSRAAVDAERYMRQAFCQHPKFVGKSCDGRGATSKRRTTLYAAITLRRR